MSRNDRMRRLRALSSQERISRFVPGDAVLVYLNNHAYAGIVLGYCGQDPVWEHTSLDPGPTFRFRVKIFGGIYDKMVATPVDYILEPL